MVESEFSSEFTGATCNPAHLSTDGAGTTLDTSPHPSMVQPVTALRRAIVRSLPRLPRHPGHTLHGRFMARHPACLKLAGGAFGWLHAPGTRTHLATLRRQEGGIAPAGATADLERADITTNESFDADSRITLTRRVYVVV